jgi:hypothetical protein
MFKISITGGDKRIRTAGICRAKAALYQLSYIPSDADCEAQLPSSFLISEALSAPQAPDALLR